MLVKLGIVGLAIAVTIQIRQYWVDHAAIGASPEEFTTIATGLPVKPPAQWAGLPPTPRPTGVVTPPAVYGPYTNNPFILPRK
jgi:hypothetical protein